MEKKESLNHVVMFPLPLQGPINSTFKLAELLLLSGLNVTFLLNEYIYRRLVQTTNDIETTMMKRYTGRFQLKFIPDGLTLAAGGDTLEAFHSVKSTVEPNFREMLTSGSLNSEKQGDVSCIIADGSWGFVCDIGKEIGVPVFIVRTISPCCLWAFFCLPGLIEAGELPFQGDDLDILIKGVPGTEGFLRRRDLPSFYREPNLDHGSLDIARLERIENPKAHGLILNSFEELDDILLPHLRTICPNIYTLGPLHAYLKMKLAENTTLLPGPSASIWEEDMGCLNWLDEQPPKSVLYVSFGSVVILTKDNLYEIWHGLVDSGINFLWAMRPDSVVGNNWENDIPEKLSIGTKKRGQIVKWAPQEHVLEHEAVAGFLTHSGWNSTLESICAGVPMICWPLYIDQQTNSRFVSEVWNLGLDMKDTCDRRLIEKMVKELMVERKEEFSQNAYTMAKLATKCLSEGGSSFKNMKRLVKDIVASSHQQSDVREKSVQLTLI